ncbi:Lrp/AsnC family transcriptional regulator [Streptomyces atratus]|uniref:Lrp/AsnC family transcriptional regulator n=1 Tax=Streptomyces atratus TaxID=1893 RepID=UPI00366895B9
MDVEQIRSSRIDCFGYPLGEVVDLFGQVLDAAGQQSQGVTRGFCHRLRQNGDIAFRCDVARELAGWHTMALLWLTVPDMDLRAVGHRVASWPETRMCAAMASPTNLALIVNLRSFEHLEEVLIRIATKCPGVAVTERRLLLRQVKVYGRLVDESGRCVEVIPPDPWAADPGATAG